MQILSIKCVKVVFILLNEMGFVGVFFGGREWVGFLVLRFFNFSILLILLILRFFSFLILLVLLIFLILLVFYYFLDYLIWECGRCKESTSETVVEACGIFFWAALQTLCFAFWSKLGTRCKRAPEGEVRSFFVLFLSVSFLVVNL